MNKVVGAVLVVLGLIGLIWGGFSYTTRKPVVDIGPIHASQDQKHEVPLPPIVGVVALVGGVVLLASGRRV